MALHEIKTISEFYDIIGERERIFSLDIGSKTIGIAISDPHRRVSTPLYTIKRKKFTQDAENLIALINENNVKGLVIGLPLLMDGQEGKKCQSVRQFGRNLQKIHDIAIIYWDERFSTIKAQEILDHTQTPMSKQKDAIDKIAASHILQSMLDTAIRMSEKK